MHPKVPDLSSDTGGGHRSAAKTIADGFERFWKASRLLSASFEAVEESHNGNTAVR